MLGMEDRSSIEGKNITKNGLKKQNNLKRKAKGKQSYQRNGVVFYILYTANKDSLISVLKVSGDKQGDDQVRYEEREGLPWRIENNGWVNSQEGEDGLGK